MATTIKLEGEARSEFGKGVARRLRVANKIPESHKYRVWSLFGSVSFACGNQNLIKLLECF